MSRRGLVAAALTAAALVGFAGCSSGQAPGPDAVTQQDGQQGQPPAVTAALDRAVGGLDAARTELLQAPAAVVTAAMALDAADEASATGSARTARAARGPARGAVDDARAAVASLPDRVRAYRAALSALERAAAPLAADQEQALATVVIQGEAEVAATEAFAVAAGKALPAYARLDEAQARWVERASAGWYRDAQEAAGAYAVLVRPQQAALQAARDGLGAADEARRAATDRQRAALSAADAALAPLRAAG